MDPINCIIGIVLTHSDTSPYKAANNEEFNKNKQIHQAETKSSLRGMIETDYNAKVEIKD